MIGNVFKWTCRFLFFLFLFSTTPRLLSATTVQIPQQPWQLYLGVSQGMYGDTFEYSAVYEATSLRRQRSIQNMAAQQPYSVGAQLGLNLHFDAPYFIGVLLSESLNTNKAAMALQIDNRIINNFLANLMTQVRVSSVADLAFVFGRDLSDQSHVFAKLGPSFARINEQVTFANANTDVYMPAFVATQHKNIMGAVLGVGLIQDLNPYYNLFFEYDYYDYPSREMNSLTDMVRLFSNISDSLSQSLGLGAYAVRLGINIKITGQNPFAYPIWATNDAWRFFFGGAFGISNVTYNFGTNYFTHLEGTIRTNTPYENTAIQRGNVGGGQIGFAYHLHAPYSIGLIFSDFLTSNKARFENFIESSVAPRPPVQGGDINQQVRVNNIVDIAPTLGIDITPQTQVYLKLGPSVAHFKQKLSANSDITGTTTPSFEQKESKNFLGLLTGLGIEHAINNGVSFFGEYDSYYYGRHNLKNTNLILSTAVNPTNYTQNVRTTAFAMKFGFNFSLANEAIKNKALLSGIHGWELFFGGLSGVYNASYHYHGIFIRAIRLRQFDSDVGNFGGVLGGQLGFNYHFTRPYFIGWIIESYLNWNKSDLTEYLDNDTVGTDLPVSLNENFQIVNMTNTALVLGANISDLTHIYVKAGPSFSNFKFKLASDSVILGGAVPTTYLEARKNLMGYLLGLGLSFDVSTHASLFAEGEFFNFNDRALPGGSIVHQRNDSLTHNFLLSMYLLKAGVNVKFNI